MLANYFKIALRNLLKHKSHSIISISGLALGLACSLSILLFIQDELSYDQYHVNEINSDTARYWTKQFDF